MKMKMKVLVKVLAPWCRRTTLESELAEQHNKQCLGRMRATAAATLSLALSIDIESVSILSTTPITINYRGSGVNKIGIGIEHTTVDDGQTNSFLFA